MFLTARALYTDTSRAEMSDVHSEESVMKHGYYAEHEMPVSLTDPSHATSTRGAFEASGSVSGSSAAAAAADQAESPVAPDHGPYRLSDSGHVRSLSETLASPFGLTFANDPSSEQGEATRLSLPPRRPSDQVSSPPVSPPTAGDTAGDTQAEDYLAARPDVVSPVLRESDESGEVMEKKGFAHT